MIESATEPDSGLSAIEPGGRIAPGHEDGRFYLWVALTFVLHLSLLIGINRAEPRRLGATGGADDAISVSILTEADLRGNATVEDQAAGPLSPPSPPPALTTPAPPQPQPIPEPPDQTAAESPNPAPPPLRDSVTGDTPAPAETKPETEPPVIAATPELLALPDPAAPPATPKAKREAPPSEAQPDAQAPKPDPAKPKPEKAKPKPAADPKPQQTAKLDLTPPALFQAPVGGGGAGVQRPAGITRSGENDDFARGVIRALQITMPQLRDTRGRVTVRITLDMKGNLASTEVLRPSTVAGLDQSVVFATRQSSFPFPPHNAKPVDLVFIVTYIYR